MTGVDDGYRAFVALFTANEPRLRGFVRTLLPAWADVDEVMQEVALVAWRKFDQLADGGGFLRWACVIARFEALRHRRRLARDRLVFGEELLERIAEEAAKELDLRERQARALDDCLAALPTARRELLLASCAADASTRELAARIGKQPGALYTMLHRLRAELLACVRRRIASQDGA